MFLLITAVWIGAMLFSDWRDGTKEGPRPTRTKLVYSFLLLIIVYHTAATLSRSKLPVFPDMVRALLGMPAKAAWDLFQTKG